MKKLMLVVTAAIAVLFTGCKKPPTPEVMYATSYAIGVAAAKVANEIKMDDTTRNAMVDVINLVVQVVPEVDQTFEEAWTPIANTYIDKMAADGKITIAQANLIKSAFTLVVKGIDYIFTRRPDAKQYENLVVSAIDGFAKGFLEEFKPVNAAARVYRPFDRKAFNYLKALRK